MRKEYLEELNEALNTKHLSAVLPGDATINYSNNGYAEQGLAETLLKNRKNDAKKGYTSSGPHRADIGFYYQGVKVEKDLSRGQTKLFAAALISSQLEKAKAKGGTPIMLVDDLSAELDQKASEKMLRLLLANKTQTFVTSIAPPNKTKQKNDNMAVFHVERGNIKKMLK